MNRPQKIALIIGGLLMLLSGLFPIWSLQVKGFEIRVVRKIIYASSGAILPESLEFWKRQYNEEYPAGSLVETRILIDYSRMKVEFAIILLTTIGAVVFFKKKV